MRTKDQWIADFHEWIPFVQSLRTVQPEQWSTPIAEGKWSVHEIVSHILRWDEFYLEKAFFPIEQGTPLLLHTVDIDSFNEDAVNWGKGLSQEQLIQEAVQVRQQVLKCLQRIPVSLYEHEFAAIDQLFVLERFLDDLYHHDQHHMQQIQAWLS